MSKAVASFLKHNVILTNYARMGLINIAALSKYIQEQSNESAKNTSLAAIGMDVRRYLAQLPKTQTDIVNFSDSPLSLVTRTNMREIILTKTAENRRQCLTLFQHISQTKYFSCLVEGEKEIVLLTDYPLHDLMKKSRLKNMIAHHTDGLGFISIDFPIKLREVVGVYSHITHALLLANISIHSFHTIGGEILILVKNTDLLKAQEVLTTTLQVSSEDLAKK